MSKNGGFKNAPGPYYVVGNDEKLMLISTFWNQVEKYIYNYLKYLLFLMVILFLRSQRKPKKGTKLIKLCTVKQRGPINLF